MLGYLKTDNMFNTIHDTIYATDNFAYKRAREWHFSRDAVRKIFKAEQSLQFPKYKRIFPHDVFFVLKCEFHQSEPGSALLLGAYLLAVPTTERIYP